MQSVGDRDSILDRLKQLALELQVDGVKAGIHVVGGAAISLAYGRRDVTFDIDIVDMSSSEVLAAARRVAERNGWDQKWLSPAALAYYPPMANREWVVVEELPSLTVFVATSETLLA